MSPRVFAVRQATGHSIEAPVLMDPITFSPRYDLDRVSGSFSRSDHPLHGKYLASRILASPGVQGGVAGGWAFLAMQGMDVGPAGLIFGEVNPVMVQGAVTAGIPVAAGIESEFFDQVKTGTIVRIEPSTKTVRLI